MKTAEEWNVSIYDSYDIGSSPSKETLTVIKQIQLDAMKEGMRRVADKVYGANYDATNGGFDAMRKSILTTAEQLTEKDLESSESNH